MQDWDTRFRETHDWAKWHGAATAWPNFHEADYGDGLVRGTFLVPDATVDWRDVPASSYGVWDVTDVPAMFRGANDYAVDGVRGRSPELPPGRLRLGPCLWDLLRPPGRDQFRDVAAAELGVFDRTDAPRMMRAASDYAAARGYAAAFPTFPRGRLWERAGLRSRAVPRRHSFLPRPASRLAPRILRRSDAHGRHSVCRPSDVPAAAGFRQRWLDFFLPAGSDPSNVNIYWRDLSFGQYDAAGTLVSGWLDIQHTMGEVNAISGGAQRQQLATWGREAAARANIPLGKYHSIVIGYNVNADHGSVGGNTTVLSYAERWNRSNRPSCSTRWVTRWGWVTHRHTTRVSMGTGSTS